MPLLAVYRFGQTIKLCSLCIKICQHIFCKYRSPAVIWYLLGNAMDLLIYNRVVISEDILSLKSNMFGINNISYSRNCLFWVTGILLNYYPDMMLFVIHSLFCHLPLLNPVGLSSNDKPFPVIRNINLYYHYICPYSLGILCSSWPP